MPVSPTTFDPAHSGSNVILSAGNLSCRPVAQQNSSRATNGWAVAGVKTVQWDYIYSAIDVHSFPCAGYAIGGDPYDGNGLCGFAATCSQGGFMYTDNNAGTSLWTHAGGVNSVSVTNHIGSGAVNDVISCVFDPVGLTLAVYYIGYIGPGSYAPPALVYTITGLAGGVTIFPTLGQGNANGPGSPTLQTWLGNFGASPFAATIGDISFDTAIGVISNVPSQFMMANQ